MCSSPWNFKLCQYSGTSTGGRCLIVWCWHSWEPGKECITELVVAVMVDKHETEIRSCLFISTSMTSGMSSTRFMGCWRTRGSVHKWCYQFTCIKYILKYVVQITVAQEILSTRGLSSKKYEQGSEGEFIQIIVAFKSNDII